MLQIWHYLYKPGVHVLFVIVSNGDITEYSTVTYSIMNVVLCIRDQAHTCGIPICIFVKFCETLH